MSSASARREELWEDTKIYLITCLDKKGNEIVSHGVGNITLKGYCLPCELLSTFKPHKDQEGFYIATAAAQRVRMRLMVKGGDGKWVTTDAPTSPDQLSVMMWEYDGKDAVVCDDDQGIYYCGKQELVAAYVAKGKLAKTFLDLDRWLFYNCAPTDLVSTGPELADLGKKTKRGTP